MFLIVHRIIKNSISLRTFYIFDITLFHTNQIMYKTMKNLSFKILMFSLLSLTILQSCSVNCIHGSGDKLKEDRKVINFTSINISGNYKIILVQDSSLILNITADGNILKDIRTNVNNDELKIDTKRNICANTPILITIGVRNLKALKGSGAIEFMSNSKLNVKDISIDLAGAGKVNLDVNADNVITNGSGSTNISLKGQAITHTATITGSGSLNAPDFVVNKYDIRTTGSSDCKINVLTELNVHTTGASNIQYHGNPATINNSKTGASNIKKLD